MAMTMTNYASAQQPYHYGGNHMSMVGQGRGPYDDTRHAASPTLRPSHSTLSLSAYQRKNESAPQNARKHQSLLVRSGFGGSQSASDNGNHLGDTSTAGSKEYQRSETPTYDMYTPRNVRTPEPRQSIRDSLLRGMRRGAGLEDRPPSRIEFRPSSPNFFRRADPQQSPHSNHKKKESISTPFNFQHVTHATRKPLPELDTEDEARKPQQYWTVSLDHGRGEHLRGIDAAEIQHVPRQTPFAPHAFAPLGSKPGASPRDHGVRNQNFEPLWESERYERGERPSIDQVVASKRGVGPPSWRQPDSSGYIPRFPKRKASLQAHPQLTPPKPAPISKVEDPTESVPEPPISVEKEASPNVTKATDLPSLPREEKPLPKTPLESLLIPEPFALPISDEQILPSRLSQRLSQATEESEDDTLRQFPSVPSVLSSNNSRRTSRLIGMSPQRADSKTRSKRLSRVLLDQGWEESVDFAYDQEMESTCDVDWTSIAPPLRQSLTHIGSTPPPRYKLYPTLSSPEESPELSQDDSADVRVPSSRSRSTTKSQQHRTRPSVGHYGFLEARKGEGKIRPLSMKPHVLELDGPATESPAPSPLFSMTSAEAQMFIDFDKSMMSTEDNCLSDPESIRTHGSHHRQSSSCGSYDSGTLSSGTSHASTSSVGMPKLLHSRQSSMSRKSLSKKKHVQRPSISQLVHNEDMYQHHGNHRESSVVPMVSPQAEPLPGSSSTNMAATTRSETSMSSPPTSSHGHGHGHNAGGRHHYYTHSHNTSVSETIPESPTLTPESPMAGWI